MLLFSCDNHKTTKSAAVSHVKIKKNDIFLFDYAGLEKGLAKDTNKYGVFFTLPDKWLLTATEFIKYDDLDKDKSFKIIGTYSTPVNELSKLKIGDRFQMVVQGEQEIYVVFDKDSTSIMVKDPRMTVEQWSMNIPFANYNPHFFKKLTK